jgi:hypothetical protein
VIIHLPWWKCGIIITFLKQRGKKCQPKQIFKEIIVLLRNVCHMGACVGIWLTCVHATVMQATGL